MYPAAICLGGHSQLHPGQGCNRVAGIANIEQASKAGSEWVASARLKENQSNQGRRLAMDPREIRTYRVRLYGVSQ
jgi:hypothetical protein